MTCPQCGRENTDDWPLRVEQQVMTGGCQACWEAESDRGWWEYGRVLEEAGLINQEEE